MKKRKNKRILTAAVLSAAVLTGCAARIPAEDTVILPNELYSIEDEAVALADSPAAVPTSVSAEAAGELVKKNSYAEIDYSGAESGYVMVRYLAATEQRLKVQLSGPTTKYTYNLTPETWETFPVSDGSGEYRISIFRNVEGNKYAAVLSLTVKIELESEFAPFLHSNQYVDYDAAPETVAMAEELLADTDKTVEKVALIYDYVISNLSYDKEQAATVKSGYLPVLDEVLEKKSGICFDYAALMTGMLRSNGIPCKLVVGYAGTAYHAWISVWTEESGWIDGAIFFDGESWQRMDPTFASSAGASEEIMRYIGDGANYSAKYFY